MIYIDRLRAHAALHEALTDEEQQQWGRDLREAADEIERLRLDAARYRWLRDGGLYSLPYKDHGMGPEFGTGDDLDAAIDRAMKA